MRALKHDPEKACPALDAGWEPVFGKDQAKTKRQVREHPAAAPCFVRAGSRPVVLVIDLLPGHCPSPCGTVAVLITLNPARAFPRDVTYIALAWISRGLRRTDAFGPHFDGIKQRICRLSNRNGDARQAREFLDRSARRRRLPILIDETRIAADP